MLVWEYNLTDKTVLTDKSTGEEIARIEVKSFVQYPDHTAVRLGIDAPQSIHISRPQNGNKELENRKCPRTSKSTNSSD